MLESNYFQYRIANRIVLGESSCPHYHYEFLSQNQNHRLTLQGCMMALCLSVVIFVFFFSEKSERAGGFKIAKDKRAPDGTNGPVA